MNKKLLYKIIVLDEIIKYRIDQNNIVLNETQKNYIKSAIEEQTSVTAAEDPEGRKDQAHARDAGEEQTLAAADCVIGTEIARQRGNSLFGAALAAAVERTATALQEIGKSHILTFP